MVNYINIGSIFESWISFHIINVKTLVTRQSAYSLEATFRSESLACRMNATQSCSNEL